MERVNERPGRLARFGGVEARWPSLVLGLALAAGAASVAALRQEWAKTARWPWLLLIAAMFAGAIALRRADPSLPGWPMLARPESTRPRARRLWGWCCMAAALVLAG